MLLEDVGRMSVQYVGHVLLPLKLFWMLIKETDRHCPLACVQWARCSWKRHVYIPAGVSLHSAVIHKVLFGQMHIRLWFLQIKIFFPSYFWSVWLDFFCKKKCCYYDASEMSDTNCVFCDILYVCPVPRSIEYPSWDWRESRDFDELNHILQESKKLGKALESLSRSRCLQPCVHTWAVFNLSSHTYKLNHKRNWIKQLILQRLATKLRISLNWVFSTGLDVSLCFKPFSPLYRHRHLRWARPGMH